MKKSFIGLALSLFAAGAFAQHTEITPTELCQKISRVNSSNGNICAQLISRNVFEPKILSMASQLLDRHGSSSAIELMKATGNRRYDPQSLQVCERIVPVNLGNVIPCLNTISDATFAPEVIRMSIQMLERHGSSSAIGMLKSGANIYLFPPAAAICEAMVAINSSNSIVCLQVIANKVTLNGSEQICRTALSNGSSYALECLRGIVTDYVPVPQQSTVMVDLYKLQDLKKNLMKTKAQLNRGMIENAQRSLQDAAMAVDQMLEEAGLQ